MISGTFFYIEKSLFKFLFHKGDDDGTTYKSFFKTYSICDWFILMLKVYNKSMTWVVVTLTHTRETVLLDIMNKKVGFIISKKWAYIILLKTLQNVTKQMEESVSWSVSTLKSGFPLLHFLWQLYDRMLIPVIPLVFKS